MFSTITCIFGGEKEKKTTRIFIPLENQRLVSNSSPTSPHNCTSQQCANIRRQNTIFLSNVQISSISTTPQHTNRAIIHQLGAPISCDMDREVSSPIRIFPSSSLSKSHRKIQEPSTFCSQQHRTINN